MSVLSRWASEKMRSQFTEDYVNGVKSFIFSWEENHHPIHEEALEFYLPKKFVPRPKPPPAKVPEKEETKKTEQAKLLELKKQEQAYMETRKSLEKELSKHDLLLSELKKEEPHPMEKEKNLEKEFPPERKENKKMESQAGQYQTKQASAISGTPDVHILSFLASQPSVGQVVKVFEDVYKTLAIASKPKSSTDQIYIQDYIMKYKPQYLVLVSDFDNIEDILNFDNQVQRYKEIVKKSSSVGTKLIFIITEDKNYREGDMISDAVHSIFTKLNHDIPSSEQPMVMSWNKTPWPAHKDALVQLLSPYGKVRAVPQQYGAPKQVPHTQPENVPMKRGFYRASISYGRVVQVLMSDPPGWEPDTRHLNDMLMKNGSVKKGIIEFWNQGDGFKSAFYPSEAKLSKIAQVLGVTTDQMHSVLVYSYHVEGETNEEVSNFMKHLNVHVLSPCQPIEPASMKVDITCANPDYLMLSADADVLKDADEKLREHSAQIREIFENFVGQGVIIMLFGDKYYIEGELASKEATQYVRKLTQDIVEPDRLTVMTCQNRPYTTHLDWMKRILKSKGTKWSASQGAVPSEPSHYFKAVIKSGQITEVLERIPPDWTPDEGMVRKKLYENKQERKAYLEILGNEQGETLSITVEKESKAAYYVNKFAVNSFSSWLSSDDAKNKDKEKDTSKEKSKAWKKWV